MPTLISLARNPTSQISGSLVPILRCLRKIYFRLNKHWSVTPGIRVEHINTKAEGYYYKQNIFIASEKIQETKSNPRSFALLGIGTSWKFDNGTEIYGNISQNYRSINFNDIRVINVNSRVDPGLKDETGYNIDLGYRGTIGGWLYARPQFVLPKIQ